MIKLRQILVRFMRENFGLEIDAEHKPRLVALEISKIEGGT